MEAKREDTAVASLTARIAQLASDAKTDALEQRRTAIEAIYELCREHHALARSAAPVLLQHLSDADEKIGESVAYGLSYCSSDDLEPIIEQLGNTDLIARRRAAKTLGIIGDRAIEASDALRRLLQDAHAEVRSQAAWALGLMHDVSPRTIDALFSMSALSETDLDSALHALGNIGKKLSDPRALKERQTLILDALHNPNAQVRVSAMYAMESLQLDPAHQARLLAARLADSSSDVRTRAMWKLRDLAQVTDLSDCVGLLCGIIDRRETNAGSACEVLASIKPLALEAVPFLRDAINNAEEGSLVVKAASALWAIDRQIDVALPRLEELFGDYGEEICDLVCEVGPAAAPLTHCVIRALQEDYWDLQWAASDALGAIASDDPQVLSALKEALRHPSPVVRSAAVRAFSRIGAPSVSTLIEVLASDDQAVAAWAADALGKIGQPAINASGLLAAQRLSSHAGLACWSAIALAKVAGDDVVLPKLLELLADEEREDLRREAAIALKALGPRAKPATSALRRLRNDPDEEVQVAATEALAAIEGTLH